MVRAFERFVKDRSGNFAVITALVLPLAIVAMGGVAELAMAFSTGTRLQGAVDAAALAAGRLPRDRLDEAEDVAQSYFLANFSQALEIDVTIVDNTRIIVTGTYPMDTAFLRLAQVPQLDIVRTSEVTLATNTREIALVLDTTGSMAGQKLTDMKAAVVRLVNELSQAGAANGTDTKFALVPFSSFVNAGITNGVARDFVDKAGAANPPMSEFPVGVSRLDVYKHFNQTWNGCLESREGGLDVLDTPADPTVPGTLFVPAFNPDERDPWRDQYGRTYVYYPNDFLADNAGNAWMYDRAHNFRYNATATPTGRLLGDALRAQASKNGGAFAPAHHPLARYGVTFDEFGTVKPRTSWTPVAFKPRYSFYSGGNPPQGPNFGCDSAPLISLTNSASAITSAVDKLVAAGATNIVEGISWGWKALSPQSPFTEGRSYEAKDNDKIIVLLTDGANNITFMNHTGFEKGSGYSSYSYLHDGVLTKRNGGVSKTKADMHQSMDEKVLEICSNVYDQEIKVFTILLEVVDAATSTLLEQCATSPDQFYDARDSSRLEEVFEDIRGKISRLHISR